MKRKEQDQKISNNIFKAKQQGYFYFVKLIKGKDQPLFGWTP